MIASGMAVGIDFVLINQLPDGFLSSFAILLLFPLAIAAAVAALAYFWSECPRCGNLFFMSGPLTGNRFARKCVHCGLGLWQDHAPRGA